MTDEQADVVVVVVAVAEHVGHVGEGATDDAEEELAVVSEKRNGLFKGLCIKKEY